MDGLIELTTLSLSNEFEISGDDLTDLGGKFKKLQVPNLTGKLELTEDTYNKLANLYLERKLNLTISILYKINFKNHFHQTAPKSYSYSV